MITKTKTKTSHARVKDILLHSILKEIRSLRNAIDLFLRSENLEGYSNPERIKTAYKKAIKKYPIDAVWK